MTMIITLKKLLLFTAFLFVFELSYAQQDAYFSQGIENYYFLNPAAGGLSGFGELSIGNRMQWLSVEGNPQTFYVSGQSQIRFKKSSNPNVLNPLVKSESTVFSEGNRTVGRKNILGGKVILDQIGPFKTTQYSGSFAVHLPVNSKMCLGIGLGLGMRSFGIDNSRVSLANQIDYAYYSYFGQVSNQNYLDANAGLVFYGEKFLVSLSTSQLFNNDLTVNDLTTTNKHVRHYFGTVAYSVFESKTLKVEPIISFRAVPNTPFNLEFCARVSAKKYGWAIAGVRGSGRTVVGLGTNLFNHFKVVYAVEFGIGKTSGFGNGTHEIQLAYRFGSSKKSPKVEENNDFVPLPSSTTNPTENDN